MEFNSVRDMRTASGAMWSRLAQGDEVVITNNGKPSALMIEIPEGGFDETVQAVRQARAMIAMNRMRRRAAEAGYMSDAEIEAAIAEARRGDGA